jgi:arabinogalactan endo-1,4-beta-galactosidase
MKKTFCFFLIFCAAAVFCAAGGCKKNTSVAGTSTGPTGGGGNTPPPPADTGAFAKGADVSWLTQMEGAGMKFYNSASTQEDCITLLKELGINSIRLRVWVNPSDGWCNVTDMVAKAIRAKAAGMKILIDFHYSDVWADPGHQSIPSSWAGQSIGALAQSVTAHTTAVLTTLKNNGITPAWVQVGNETNNGMLWPNGVASDSMNNFAQLVNAGYNAVKAVDTSIKVIVHISNGYDNNLFRWMFDGLKSNGAHWDIIGMSLYPTAANWSTLNTQCLTNMNDMVSRYGKQVMIAEIGMSWTDASACNSFITDLIGKVKSVSGGNGLGVFYWEPESYNGWQGYGLGAFDNSGRPTVAMNAFK